MNSDCDNKIKSSSRYYRTELCTKLNYVYTSRQCDQYLSFLEELRTIISGKKQNMSPEVTTRGAHSIHYHTRNGRTLTYQLENAADYGISLSPLSSETETNITETVFSESHVAPPVERAQPLEMSHFPTEIEERMLCCLRSSKDYISSDIKDPDYYFPSTTKRHVVHTVYRDAAPHAQKTSIEEPNKLKNRTTTTSNDGLEHVYSEDVFAYGEAEDLEGIVNEEFAVMEEFATVLEESESVFEEVDDHTEDLDDYVVTTEEVIRILESTDPMTEERCSVRTEDVSCAGSTEELNAEVPFADEERLSEEVSQQDLAIDSETSGSSSSSENELTDETKERNTEKFCFAARETNESNSTVLDAIENVSYLKLDSDDIDDIFSSRPYNEETMGFRVFSSYTSNVDEEVEGNGSMSRDERVPVAADSRSESEGSAERDPLEISDTDSLDDQELFEEEDEGLEMPDDEPFENSSFEEAIEDEGHLNVSIPSIVESDRVAETFPTEDDQNEVPGTMCNDESTQDESPEIAALGDPIEEGFNVLDRLTNAISQSEDLLKEEVPEQPGTTSCSPAASDIGELATSVSEHVLSEPQNSTNDDELMELVRNYVNLVISTSQEIIPTSNLEDLEENTLGGSSCSFHVNSTEFRTDNTAHETVFMTAANVEDSGECIEPEVLHGASEKCEDVEKRRCESETLDSAESVESTETVEPCAYNYTINKNQVQSESHEDSNIRPSFDTQHSNISNSSGDSVQTVILNPNYANDEADDENDAQTVLQISETDISDFQDDIGKEVRKEIISVHSNDVSGEVSSRSVEASDTNFNLDTKGSSAEQKVCETPVSPDDEEHVENNEKSNEEVSLQDVVESLVDNILKGIIESSEFEHIGNTDQNTEEQQSVQEAICTEASSHHEQIGISSEIGAMPRNVQPEDFDQSLEENSPHSINDDDVGFVSDESSVSDEGECSKASVPQEIDSFPMQNTDEIVDTTQGDEAEKERVSTKYDVYAPTHQPTFENRNESSCSLMKWTSETLRRESSESATCSISDEETQETEGHAPGTSTTTNSDFDTTEDVIQEEAKSEVLDSSLVLPGTCNTNKDTPADYAFLEEDTEEAAYTTEKSETTHTELNVSDGTPVSVTTDENEITAERELRNMTEHPRVEDNSEHDCDEDEVNCVDTTDTQNDMNDGICTGIHIFESLKPADDQKRGIELSESNDENNLSVPVCHVELSLSEFEVSSAICDDSKQYFPESITAECCTTKNEHEQLNSCATLEDGVVTNPEVIDENVMFGSPGRTLTAEKEHCDNGTDEVELSGCQKDDGIEPLVSVLEEGEKEESSQITADVEVRELFSDSTIETKGEFFNVSTQKKIKTIDDRITSDTPEEKIHPVGTIPLTFVGGLKSDEHASDEDFFTVDDIGDTQEACSLLMIAYQDVIETENISTIDQQKERIETYSTALEHFSTSLAAEILGSALGCFDTTDVPSKNDNFESESVVEGNNTLMPSTSFDQEITTAQEDPGFDVNQATDVCEECVEEHVIGQTDALENQRSSAPGPSSLACCTAVLEAGTINTQSELFVPQEVSDGNVGISEDNATKMAGAVVDNESATSSIDVTKEPKKKCLTEEEHNDFGKDEPVGSEAGDEPELEVNDNLEVILEIYEHILEQLDDTLWNQRHQTNNFASDQNPPLDTSLTSENRSDLLEETEQEVPSAHLPNEMEHIREIIEVPHEEDDLETSQTTADNTERHEQRDKADNQLDSSSKPTELIPEIPCGDHDREAENLSSELETNLSDPEEHRSSEDDFLVPDDSTDALLELYHSDSCQPDEPHSTLGTSPYQAIVERCESAPPAINSSQEKNDHVLLNQDTHGTQSDTLRRRVDGFSSQEDTLSKQDDDQLWKDSSCVMEDFNNSEQLLGTDSGFNSFLNESLRNVPVEEAPGESLPVSVIEETSGQVSSTQPVVIAEEFVSDTLDINWNHQEPENNTTELAKACCGIEEFDSSEASEQAATHLSIHPEVSVEAPLHQSPPQEVANVAIETSPVQPDDNQFDLLPEISRSTSSTSEMISSADNEHSVQTENLPCKQKHEENDLVDQDPPVINIPTSSTSDVSVVPGSLLPMSSEVPESSSSEPSLEVSPTGSSFSQPKPIETSLVVEEVSYLLTTVCVAALAFSSSPSESSSTPFDSEIIEDASKYFSTDPKPDNGQV